MRQDILADLYQKDLQLTYLRYHPKWYIVLNQDPSQYKNFLKEVEISLHLTPADRINKLKKQVDFVNGIIHYLNS